MRPFEVVALLYEKNFRLYRVATKQRFRCKSNVFDPMPRFCNVCHVFKKCHSFVWFTFLTKIFMFLIKILAFSLIFCNILKLYMFILLIKLCFLVKKLLIKLIKIFLLLIKKMPRFCHFFEKNATFLQRF